jgi:3'-phosphoadenosine 5'-phosphosulfate sulfotransferase (PAPS reductase)/FAD synthetase
MTNPYFISEPSVISFSGGRTSAYMLYRILEAHSFKLPEETMVIFANTGKEDEETLKFVKACQDNWNVPITWVEYRASKPGYEIVTYETASRNGEPFEQLITKKKYLPNTFARFCTQELKVNLMKKVFPLKYFVTLVGIRADEPRRVAKMAANKDEKYCPLAVAGVTQKDVIDFWKQNSFDLKLTVIDGKTPLGNCDLCFLKDLKQKLSIVKRYPEKVVWWEKMETQIGATFRRDHPEYRHMVSKANEQVEMFADESIPCFCGD